MELYRKNGEIVTLGSFSGSTEVAEKQWTSDWKQNWKSGGDGWMYYKKVLKAGESTENILSGIDFHDVDDTRYGDAKYSLTFQMEMVQAIDDLSVAQDAVDKLFSRGFSLYAATAGDWTSNKYEIVLNWHELC